MLLKENIHFFDITKILFHHRNLQIHTNAQHFFYLYPLIASEKCAKISFFALWFSRVYLSNASLFHLPHLFMATLLPRLGKAASALGRAALKDLQLYSFASSPKCGFKSFSKMPFSLFIVKN
jgi:hypothetical protein